MKEFFENLISSWWGITIICIVAVALWVMLSALLYRPFFKRFYDFTLSLVAIIVLSPLLLVLTIVGAIAMGGNPFFVQLRPGKKDKNGNEKIFKLIKFRTMNNKKDADGNLLPDEQRLTRYGKFLRSTSLDELGELVNILKGDMSIVGPRPLLVKYLPLYNERQRCRHNVRPGLTGYAQVHGRNAISWEEKFKLDVYYVEHISLWMDISILFKTIGKVFKRSGISQEGQATMEFFTGNKEYNVLILSAGRRVELVNCFKVARDRLGVNGKVYAADMSSTAPALYFADDYFIIPRISSETYIDTIIRLCRENRIALIVPTIDTELCKLAENKEKIESESGAKVMVSDYEAVAVCCDKNKTARYFAEHGFDFPRVVTENDILTKNYKFPLFVKPENGSSSINAFRVNNEQELEFFMKYIERPILQECVVGTEYTVDCFSDFDGNVISIVPRVRLVTRSGEILKGKTDKNRKIIDNVTELVKMFGFIGQTTVQCFLCDDGKIRYIEINPRFGGGAPMSINAGADSCEYLYRLLRGETLGYRENWETGAIYSRFDNSVRIPVC